jgi:hypothetical protein
LTWHNYQPFYLEGSSVFSTWSPFDP